MFHHFPKELGTDHYLVRSTSFHYHEKPIGSFITRVVQSGHRRHADGRYLTRSLPPLGLGYTTSPLEDPDFYDYPIREVDPESLANLPGGIDGGNYRWIDLDGESISGVLTEQGDAWFYKPNLGNGRFGAVETVIARPSIAALTGGRQQLLDLAGDGNLDLVDLSPPAPGFHERTLDAGWKGFRAFRSVPVRDWSDPNLRFVDLTGDGIADVLVTQNDAFTWHPSLLLEGFGPGIRVPVPLEEEKGPRVIFADGTQSIYLADMSGDGLSDLVRIRNGEVCYWPNRGYGQFGAKITMDQAPWFDEPELFDQRRIRLADTDGSGPTDILYLGRDGLKIFLNETGNGWSSARHLRQFPSVDNVASITVTDFLGRGTACLLWSSPLPRELGRQLRYVDLMCGRKPHLLARISNNMGAETRIDYASSTEFYLADKLAGTPWVTRLPFPVHVVRRVQTYDAVSRNRIVTRYSYHPRFLRRAGARVPWLRPGRPTGHRGFRDVSGGGRSGGGELGRREQRAAGPYEDLVPHRCVPLGRSHLATPGTRVFCCAGRAGQACRHHPAAWPDAVRGARGLSGTQGRDAAPGSLCAGRFGPGDRAVYRGRE